MNQCSMGISKKGVDEYEQKLCLCCLAVIFSDCEGKVRNLLPIEFHWGDYPMRVSALSKGDRIRIKKEFRDYDRQKFEVGQELDFLDRDYFPYDGGHTLNFVQTVMRLSEDSDEDLLIIRNEGEEYFELMKRGAA